MKNYYGSGERRKYKCNGVYMSNAHHCIKRVDTTIIPDGEDFVATLCVERGREVENLK